MRILGSPSVSLADKAKNIAFMLVVTFIWVTMIVALLNHLSVDGQIRTVGMTFFMACIWAPIWEETVYRWAPLTIARRYTDNTGINVMWPVIIISNALFGWGHGQGPYSLLIQGAIGLALSMLFIKNNYSLLSTIIAHSMWNTFVIFIL